MLREPGSSSAAKERAERIEVAARRVIAMGGHTMFRPGCPICELRNALNPVAADRLPVPAGLDVFVMMDAVRADLETMRRDGLVEKIAAVLDALTDADVTWGYISGEDCGPMMTERDAIVRALYCGSHVKNPPKAAVRNLSSTAWLVERGQAERHVPTVWRIAGPKPDYRAGEQWTEDAYEATRYATREEAQAVVDALFTGPSSRMPDNVTARATEHAFIERADATPVSVGSDPYPVAPRCDRTNECCAERHKPDCARGGGLSGLPAPVFSGTLADGLDEPVSPADTPEVCATCDGDGYTEEFNADMTDVIITLCPDCAAPWQPDGSDA